MQELYRNAPQIYDEQFRDWSRHFEDAVAEYNQEHVERKAWIMGVVEDLKPGTILDVGCGVGYPALRPLYERGYRIIGLDISREYLDECHGLPVMRGDAHHLPFKDSSFDLVIATEILEHVPLIALGMTEIKRVTKKAIFSAPHELGPPDGKIHVRSFDQASFAALLDSYMSMERLDYLRRENRPCEGMPGWWMALCESP